MRYLVTGSSGFLGRHLARRLVFAGHDVGMYDLVEGDDVLDYTRLLRRIEDLQPDVILHLAADAVVWNAAAHAIKAYTLAAVGTANVLEAARVTGVEQVVLASSHHAYAEPSIYASSKWASEAIVRGYRYEFGKNAIAVRLPNVYGPDDPHTQHLIPSIIRSLLAGQRPILRSNGKARRAYIYADDFGDGLLSFTPQAWPKDVMDIKGTDPISAVEIAGVIGRLMRREHLPPVVLDEAGDSDVFSVNATENPNWRPRWSLEEGLEATIAWYQEEQAVAV